MTQMNLENLTLDELKTLKRDIARAIRTYRHRQKKEAIAAVEAAAREFGFSLSELTGARPKRTNPPKYQNPAHPELTWSGLGRKPDWFKDAVEAGKAPEDLLIA